MSAGRAVKAFCVLAAGLSCVLTSLVFSVPAGAGTGVGSSGNTVTNAAQAQSPFTPGTFDSGQPIDVVIPTNTVFNPGASIFILECAAPGGVNPTTSGECDGNTGYQGGTITVQPDGSVDVINTSTSFGTPYTVYALPDAPTLHESPSSTPKCGLGSANECVLYIGQGGGGDTGFAQPHFFSQAFQVHPDPTDSGTLTPGDGTFPADSAPAITSANHATFTEGTAGSFSVTATGFGPPAFTEVGTLPAGVTLKTTYSGNTSTGVLAGTPTVSGSFPITITANNGVGTPATQSFTLTVNGTGTAPTITSLASTTFTKGTAGTFTVTATGSPAPTFTETGALPSGVTLTAGGLLSGTPTVTGSFPITITAANGVTPNATQSFTLTVDAGAGHHLWSHHHLHQGHRGHLHGHRHRIARAHLHRDRFAAHRGHPDHRRRALRHTDRQWRLPDHHHRRQRGHPQRHPELHPRCRRAAGDHLGSRRHLHRRHRGHLHRDRHRFPRARPSARPARCPPASSSRRRACSPARRPRAAPSRSPSPPPTESPPTPPRASP